MSTQTETTSYARKDSFNLNKLSQSLPETNAPLTMDDRKLSARGRNLLLSLAAEETANATTANKSEGDTLVRKVSLKGFRTGSSLGSFDSMQDLLRQTNSFPKASIFDQTVRNLVNNDVVTRVLKTWMLYYSRNMHTHTCMIILQPAGTFNKNSNSTSPVQSKTLLTPCFGSLASIEDHIMDNSRRT